MSSPRRWPMPAAWPRASRPWVAASDRALRRAGSVSADEADEGGRARGDVGVDRDVRLDRQADVGQRAGDVEGAERRPRRARVPPTRRAPSAGPPRRAPATTSRPGPGAPRPEHRRVDPPVLDQQGGAEQDRVGRQDDELDRQQQDAGPADEQRSLGLGEDLRQARGHRHVGGERRVEPRAQPAHPGRRGRRSRPR